MRTFIKYSREGEVLSVLKVQIMLTHIEQPFADLPTLEEIERRYLLHVLDAAQGNRTRAAEILGVDRRTLYRMAERFGIALKE